MCARCNTVKIDSGSRCSLCGSLDQSVTVELVGVEARAEVGDVGTVVEQRDASDGQFQIRTQTPEGARSNGLLAGDTVSLGIHGPTKTGRTGEARAIDVLLSKLLQDGQEAVLEVGRDDRGEDGVLLLHGDQLTLQVVSLPSDPKLWRDANSGSATRNVPVVHATMWIRDAILAKFAKTSHAECTKTVLVLDAALAGILSAHEVVGSYLALHGNPRTEFGFHSGWLVGPTLSTTTRLGAACE